MVYRAVSVASSMLESRSAPAGDVAVLLAVDSSGVVSCGAAVLSVVLSAALSAVLSGLAGPQAARASARAGS